MSRFTVPQDQLTGVGSSMTIEETEASTPGGKPMRLVLMGGGLPKKGGANWGTELREKTTWYGGNREGSQQVLGPMEMPSTWSGEWNRTRLSRAACFFYDETGSKATLIDPIALVNAVDRLQLGGARLRATWAVRGSEIAGNPTLGSASLRQVDVVIVREGRIKQFPWTPDGHTDIDWTMTWTWLGRGPSQARVANAARDEDLTNATSAVASSVAFLEKTIAGKIAGLPKVTAVPHTLTMGQIEAIANTPQLIAQKAAAKLRYNVGQFQRAAGIAKKVATTPLAIQNVALDLARNTTAVANSTVDEMGRIPIEYQSKNYRVASLARSGKYFGSVQDSLSTTARTGSNLEQRTRGAVVAGGNRGVISVRDSSTTRAGDILSIHVCKIGETPDRVSVRYYGTPDQADAILRSNRLPAHTPLFRPGQILVIPALGASSKKA